MTKKTTLRKRGWFYFEDYMNGVFKTFWENGGIRLLVVYTEDTGRIRLRRIFDENGNERQPSSFLESKRNIEDIYDDIWPRFKLFDKAGKEIEPFDAQEDYLEETQKIVYDEVGNWDDYGNYGGDDYGYYNTGEDWTLNSKFSDGWEE